MLEIIYKGNSALELIWNQMRLSVDDTKTQLLTIENHHVLYVCDLQYDGTVNHLDAIFVRLDKESDIDSILLFIKPFTTKYVVPMYSDTSLFMIQKLQDFARRIMLDGYGVPKVLKPWQMIVI